MLLVPIPVNNDITGKEEDTTLALVVIDLPALSSIDLDRDTGYGTIVYRNNMIQETKVPFLALLTFFSNQGIVLNPFADRCRGISKQVDTYYNL